MNQFQYVDILANNLIPYVKKHKMGNFIFQQDNDSKHTSKYAKEYFNYKGIIFLLGHHIPLILTLLKMFGLKLKDNLEIRNSKRKKSVLTQ